MTAESVQPSVRQVTLEAAGGTLAGLLAEPEGDPRALVLALHGSGLTSQYFDCRTAPGLSLLELGAACGYSVLALDRPGYGGSAHRAAAHSDGEAEVLLSARDAFAAEHGTGAGTFIMSHSSGTKAALTMAAHERGQWLLGVEGSGTGVTFAPPFVAAREAGRHYSTLAWGSSHFYPSGARAALVSARTSRLDHQGGRDWPERIRQLAPCVAVPVRLTLAEEEGFYPTDRDALAELAALFGAAPLVEVVVEPQTGHNVSVSWAARAYHLKVLAFVERCMMLRRFASHEPR